MPFVELNLEACRAFAIAHGLPLGFIIKEFRVFDALAALAAFNVHERGELILKGGTALNKIYFAEIQRFSEDLDFDLATIRETNTAKEFISRISLLMKEEGFVPRRIRSVGRRESSLQLELSFASQFGHEDYVRLDFAIKPSIARKDIVESAVVRSSFIERVVAGVRTYSFDGLIARKIAAIAARCEGRDVYDVAQGIRMVTKNFPSVVRRMLACEREKISPRELLLKAAKNLRAANFVELRNLTNPFIPLALRPRDAAGWRAMALTLAKQLEELVSGSY